jgi:hypothetical protein
MYSKPAPYDTVEGSIDTCRAGAGPPAPPAMVLITRGVAGTVLCADGFAGGRWAASA